MCGEIDNTWHMFCNCHETQKIVKEVFKMLQIKHFNSVEFIFGTHDAALNTIYLILKWYIWKSRFYSEHFILKSLIFRIQLHIKAEQSKMKIVTFNQKWDKFLFLLKL